MALPDNGSYRRYADTGRPYVVWNVVATPEFSLEPRTWCFPVAGCIAYRGYFSASAAEKYADRLRVSGYDVFVGGVRAYSTLGHFRDPVFNTMLGLTDNNFAGLIFHELAHQLLYVDDDSAFNEGFATAIEREGLLRWSASSSGRELIRPASTDSNDARAVRKLLQRYRGRLRKAYVQADTVAGRRATKAKLFRELQAEYRELTAPMSGPKPYGLLQVAGINNAVLAALATYDDYVPAFEQLLRQCRFELDCFYAEAQLISALAADKRKLRIAALLVSAAENAAPVTDAAGAADSD
jgi:predicted aminopeptidase